MSSARQRDEVSVGPSIGGGDEGNTVEISSGRRERRIDNTSLLSLLGTCVYR